MIVELWWSIIQKNSYIRCDDKLVVAIGLADLVIVSTKDAVMVANKDNIQDLKVITVGLKAESWS